LDKLRPFALLPHEAAKVHGIIDAWAEQERESKTAGIQRAMEAMQPVEEKLRKLTRYLLDDKIDEDSYQVAKEELVLEKNRLKQERQRQSKTDENTWVEPTRKLVNALETLGKTGTVQNLPEISGLVQQIGTNRLISRKTVSFSVSEDYESVPSLLASVRASLPATVSVGHAENHESSEWCPC
jgi:hypothetical protein